MPDQAYANAYRPKSLDEVLGQSLTVKILHNMLRKGTLPSFILLAGPAGTGKTTLGRILAALVTCRQADLEAGTSCGTCHDCLAALAGDRDGSNFMHIKGGTKGLKDLIEEDMETFVHGSPIAGARRRVVLADEAQGMTSASRTVLLHMTENLPATSMVIMTTTDPKAIDTALLTRAGKFHLAPLTPEQVVEGILRERPGLDTEESRSALALVAQALRGSMRDVWTLIQKWEALDEPLTPDLAAQLLGGVSDRERNRLWKSVFSGAYVEIQAQWKAILNQGPDPERLGDQLVEDLFRFAAARPAHRDWPDAVRILSQAQLVKTPQAFLCALYAIASPAPSVGVPQGLDMDVLAEKLSTNLGEQLGHTLSQLFQTVPDTASVVRELLGLVEMPEATDIAELTAARLLALQAEQTLKPPLAELLPFPKRLDVDDPRAVYDYLFGHLGRTSP